MIVDGASSGPFAASFDYVIIGSGAAGATAARVLADTGASLAVVEEGPAVDTAEFSPFAFASLRRLYREMGTQLARGRTMIPVLQGRCLGGSTVVNSGIIRRLPEEVLHEWQTERGLAGALPRNARGALPADRAGAVRRTDRAGGLGREQPAHARRGGRARNQRRPDRA